MTKSVRRKQNDDELGRHVKSVDENGFLSHYWLRFGQKCFKSLSLSSHLIPTESNQIGFCSF